MPFVLSRASLRTFTPIAIPAKHCAFWLILQLMYSNKIEHPRDPPTQLIMQKKINYLFVWCHVLAVGSFTTLIRSAIFRYTSLPLHYFASFISPTSAPLARVTPAECKKMPALRADGNLTWFSTTAAVASQIYSITIHTSGQATIRTPPIFFHSAVITLAFPTTHWNFGIVYFFLRLILPGNRTVPIEIPSWNLSLWYADKISKCKEKI